MQDKDVQLKKPKKTVRIYISYALKDKSLFTQLTNHMAGYKWGNYSFKADIFTIHNVSGGHELRSELDAALDRSHIILLLISPMFISTSDCMYEMERALGRSRNNSACVRTIPILLRNVADWNRLPFGGLRPLPRDGKPIAAEKGPGSDSAFVETVRGITSVIEEMLPIIPEEEPPIETAPPPPALITPQSSISALAGRSNKDELRAHIMALRDYLSYLFSREDDIDMILFDSDIPIQVVKHSGSASVTWQNALREAEKRSKLIDVVNAALGHYNNDATLQAELRFLEEHYR